MAKIFATNHDLGGALAVAPVLARLAQTGHDILVCGIASDPGFPVLRTLATGMNLHEFFGPIGISGMQELLERERPDAIVTGWSQATDTTDQHMIAAAKELNIPSALISDTWPRPGLTCLPTVELYRTSVTKVCLIDDIARGIFVDAGFNATQVVATGNPALDELGVLKRELPQHRAEMRKRFNIAPDALVIYWAVTQELETEKFNHDTYGEHLESPALLEYLTAMNEARAVNPNLAAIVRQKPTYRTDMIRAVIETNCPWATFDNERFMGGLAPVLAADLVVGTQTTVLEKAALLGIPAVSYLPDFGEKKDPTVANKIGVTIPLYARGMLRTLIFVTARTPAYINTLRERMKPCELPADATGNVVAEILALCVKPAPNHALGIGTTSI